MGHWTLSGGSSRLVSSVDAAEHGEVLYGSQYERAFELGVSERHMDLRLRLPSSTSIRGSVRVPPGVPPQVALVVTSGGNAAVLAEVAGDRYRFSDLAPGGYEVFLVSAPKRSRLVTLAEGENLVVDLDFSE